MRKFHIIESIVVVLFIIIFATTITEGGIVKRSYSDQSVQGYLTEVGLSFIENSNLI